MNKVSSLPLADITDRINKCSDVDNLTEIQRVLSQRIDSLTGFKNTQTGKAAPLLEKGERLGIGLFEEIVLQAVVTLKDRAYGGSVHKLVQEWREQEITSATVYDELNILEKKGFLAFTVAPPKAVRGGRATKYYHATEKGLEKLNQISSLRERIRKDIEKLTNIEKAEGQQA